MIAHVQVFAIFGCEKIYESEVLPMRNIFIYLSGSIQKSHEKNSYFWTEEDITKMELLFSELGINVVLLNPSSRSDDLTDEFSLFGRDMLQVYLSSCVLTDGRERRGIGVGYEMAAANFKKIPVFSWVPYNSHYRPKELVMLGQKLFNWNHPFFIIPSIKLVESLEEAVAEIAKFNFCEREPMTASDFILPAMQHYIKTNLERDQEMNSLVNKYSDLSSLVNSIRSVSLQPSLDAVEVA